MEAQDLVVLELDKRNLVVEEVEAQDLHVLAELEDLVAPNLVEVLELWSLLRYCSRRS